MDEQVSDHLAGLLYNEGAENATDDPGDILLEDELEHSDMPKRLLGSEDPDEVDPPDEGVDPDVGEEKPANHTDELLAELRSQSQGRLNEITELRSSRAEANEAMVNMRKLFLQMEQANAEKERQAEVAALHREDVAEFGEDVVNDPHMQYVAEQMARQRDEQEAQRQQQEHYRQQTAEQQKTYQDQVAAQQQAYQSTKALEDAYVKDHPDYYDAYNFAREARESMYSTRGYTPEQAKQAVNQEELYLMQEQSQIGGNIPDQVYKMAEQWGYKPKGTPGAAPQRRKVQAEQIDLGRMKAGLNSQGVGQVPGGSPGGGNEVPGGTKMTAEQFFETVPASTRMKIFMNDDDAFETLGRTGYIVVPH